MCRIDLCGQNGVKISSYGDRQFIKINPLNRPWGRFLRREDSKKMGRLCACQSKAISGILTIK